MMERFVRVLRGKLLVGVGCVALGMGTVGWGQAPAAAPAAPAAAASGDVHARGDIAGDWQATLEIPNRPSLRVVLRVTKGDKGWSGKMFVITDQGAQPANVSALTLDGSAIKFSIDQMGASYQGAVSADGSSMVGTLTGGPQPPSQPWTLVRATKETAWEIPPPPAPPKLMAADANPSFEVATIKPNDSGAPQMQGLNVNGRNFTTRNSSLADLIAFAYNLQPKQIIGAPDWMDKDRFDIAAVPDVDGAPNVNQLRVMVQKLMADRWKMTFHHDKKELSAFVLTVGKNGEKLTPNTSGGPLPGLGTRPIPGGVMMGVNNGTMSDFTGYLQLLVLDRPVVDHTGLTGKYDLSFKFMPDDSLYHGHPPKPGATTDNAETFPGFFEAIQTIGLKLDAEKTPVDVIVIDHAEKYSTN
jgi:uncharacterized protein (TIGR03435 family)